MTKGDGITITVSDLLGKQISLQQSQDLTGQLYWDTRNVSPGIYIYHATGASGSVGMGKIVVER